MSGNLYMLDDVIAGGVGTDDGELFCQNCHDLTATGAHTRSYPGGMGNNIVCANCHVSVPHGSPVSRLIAYDTMPAPYDYNNNTAAIREFIWNDFNVSGNNREGDVLLGVGCGGGGMGGGGCHTVAVPGYDAIP